MQRNLDWNTAEQGSYCNDGAESPRPVYTRAGQLLSTVQRSVYTQILCTVHFSLYTDQYELGKKTQNGLELGYKNLILFPFIKMC